MLRLTAPALKMETLAQWVLELKRISTDRLPAQYSVSIARRVAPFFNCR